MFKDTGAKTPKEYIESLVEPRKSEIQKLSDFIEKVTKLKPFMQSGMLGYGKYHYKYASGREGDWAIIALSSRKQYISLYVCAVTPDDIYIAEKYKKELAPASIGKSCIRYKKYEDIDLNVLESILKEALTSKPLGS